MHKFHWITNAPLYEPGPILGRRRKGILKTTLLFSCFYLISLLPPGQNVFCEGYHLYEEEEEEEEEEEDDDERKWSKAEE